LDCTENDDGMQTVFVGLIGIAGCLNGQSLYEFEDDGVPVSLLAAGEQDGPIRGDQLFLKCCIRYLNPDCKRRYIKQ
jgi:hypothetical protein